MKEFIEYIAKCLVDNPEDVQVEVTEENNDIRFKLFVKDEETGKVIGKAGKTAKAIRTLLTAVAAKERKRAFLEIPDKLNKHGKTDTETESQTPSQNQSESEI